MSSANFHVLAKPIGPICNLDCKYCFYLEKESLYPQVSKWAMREEVLDSYIRQYIEAHDAPVVQFCMAGRRADAARRRVFPNVLCESRRNTRTASRFRTPSRPTACCSTTHGLRSSRKANFSSACPLTARASCTMHYRVDKGGQPTFDRVMRGMETLKRNGVEFNTLTTVHRANADHPLEVYRFLKENGSGYMQFIPIVERIAHKITADGLRLISPDFARGGASGAVVC